MKMKIQLKEINNSPFRNFDRNPLVPERVTALKDSIQSTGFWDNVMVRPAPDGSGYQLAYGHHRLEAVRKAIDPKTITKKTPKGKRYTFIDIPCNEISDANMIKMMADENLHQWGHSTAAILEAVEGARDFLESGLAVCETAGEFGVYCASNTKADPATYSRMRNQGVGSPAIITFFGKSWSSQNTAVGNALKILNAGRDLEKAELAEEAAKSEEIAAEKRAAEEEATRKAEEAKAAAAVEAKAKADAEKNKAAAARATKAKSEADAKAKRAAAAASVATRTADVKRKEATKAHAAKHRIASRPNRETFEGFKKIEQSSAFTTASMKLDMTASERIKCGAYVIKHDFSSRQIPTAVESWFTRNTVAGKNAAEAAKRKIVLDKGTSLDDIVAELNATIPALAKRLSAIEPHLEHIQHKGIRATFESRILNELSPPVSKLVKRLHALSAIADVS